MTFREWTRYRYGVFSERGFSGDKLYPMTYDFGGQERSNGGCDNAFSGVNTSQPAAEFEIEDHTTTQVSML